jgi:hypothetical protein
MKIDTDQNRRSVLRNSAVFAAAAATAYVPGNLLVLPASAQGEQKEPEVTATEDLMREHGVIRRALLVYFETVPKLRHDPSSVSIRQHCGKLRNCSAPSARITTKECWKSSTFFP